MTAESGWPGAESPFPAIADYGFLSDCQCNALVAPSGNVEWMCLPRPDSPSVFAAILDRGAGSFRFGPSGIGVPAGRRYLPGTLVLETTWRTRTGWLIVRDALFVLAAARVRRFFAARPGWGRWSKRALAGVFGGLALRLAWEQKP